MKEDIVVEMEESLPLQEKQDDILSKMDVYHGVLPTYSMKTKCYQCNMEVYSVVVQTMKKDIWMWPLSFCICVCIPCLCWIYPFRKWFMEWRHYCGKCELQLATYKQPCTIEVKKTLILVGIMSGSAWYLYAYVLGKYFGIWGR